MGAVLEGLVARKSGRERGRFSERVSLRRAWRRRERNYLQ
jgi:hypothetical protein